MDYISTLTNQIAMMFLVIALGLFLKKIKFYGDDFVDSLGQLLFMVINPLTIFASFVNQYSPQKAKELFISLGLAALSASLNIIIAEILFHNKKYYMEKFATIVNNCGFFGLPIVISVFGQSAVFYAASYIAVNTIIQFTYGSYLMSGDKKTIGLKKIITNSSIVAFLAGMFFFFTRIPVPSIITTTISSLSSLMGPICALIVGSSLAGTNLKALKNDLLDILVILVRLIIVPLLTVYIFKYVDNNMFVLKFTLLINACAPSGTSTAVFARLYNRDYEKAARLVCICTLLCGLTMPFVTSIAMNVWN